MSKLRILVHPIDDKVLFREVTAVLQNAATNHPDQWEHVTGRPAVIDHYGYQTNLISAVVFSIEPGTQYYRLTIRPGEHEVFDELAALVRRRLDHTPQQILSRILEDESLGTWAERILAAVELARGV